MDNKISSGLEHLVAAKLKSLSSLDLSNCKIVDIQKLAPLVLYKSYLSLNGKLTFHFLDKIKYSEVEFVQKRSGEL